MINKSILASVTSMLKDRASGLEMTVKREDGGIYTTPCNINAWVQIANSNPLFYTKRNGIRSVCVVAKIGGVGYTALTLNTKDISFSREILEMTEEWCKNGWAITNKHKNSLIAEISEWMCNVAKHDESSWLSMDDNDLMHYITWVCDHVCRDDRYNPAFWKGFGFTDAEIKRIIF